MNRYRIVKDRIIFSEYLNSPLTNEELEIIGKYPKLEFGANFDQSVDNLPVGIKEIIFGCNFNKTIDNLPHTVKKIIFKNQSVFDQPLNNLPNVTHIIFDLFSAFNHPIDFLPQSVILISFGFSFNQPVNNLPRNLKNVTFGYDFYQELNNLPNLKYLMFRSRLIHDINNLPDTIRILKLGGEISSKITKLPRDLKLLFIRTDYILNFGQLECNPEIIISHKNIGKKILIC